MVDVYQRALQARRESGVSLIAQAVQSLRLRFGPTRNSMTEYYKYRLFDKNAVAPKDVNTFAGEVLAERIWQGLNRPLWWGLVADKVSYHLHLSAAGFRQPRLVALYDETKRSVPNVQCFHNADELQRFLREPAHYPMFAKPYDQYRSRGALGLASYDSERRLPRFVERQPIATQDFVATAEQFRNYLFQELLTPYQPLVSVSGCGLSTLRVVLLIRDGEPEVFRALWKIPTSGNMADNFWRDGNLLARLDTATGNVETLLRSRDGSYERLGVSDPAGERFLGKSAPLYTEALQECFKASRYFSMFKYQAWDIALTDEGPVALELNHNGDLGLLQVGASVGMLDEQFTSLLKESGVDLSRPHR